MVDSPCAGCGGFKRCPGHWLQWETRRNQIVKLVGEHAGADIVALEEADCFEEWYRPQLDALGYEGVYRPDQSSPCLRVGIGDSPTPDGVALFFKRDKFTLDDQIHGEDVAGQKAKFLALRLRTIDTDQAIVAAVAHLDSKKDKIGAETRAKQTKLLLSLLDSFIAAHSLHPAAIFMAGDLNATRDEECYQILTSSSHGLKDVYAEAGFANMFTSFKVRSGSYKSGEAKVRAYIILDFICLQTLIAASAAVRWRLFVALCFRYSYSCDGATTGKSGGQ